MQRRPNICYIFEKQRVQGYRCRDYKDKYKDIYKDRDKDKDKDIDIDKEKDKTKTRTNTKCIEDPTYAIFSKSREFKDIKYDQDKTDQDRPGQRREESNLADLILELAFLLVWSKVMNI